MHVAVWLPLAAQDPASACRNTAPEHAGEAHQQLHCCRTRDFERSLSRIQVINRCCGHSTAFQELTCGINQLSMRFGYCLQCHLHTALWQHMFDTVHGGCLTGHTATTTKQFSPCRRRCTTQTARQLAGKTASSGWLRFKTAPGTAPALHIRSIPPRPSAVCAQNPARAAALWATTQ